MIRIVIDLDLSLMLMTLLENEKTWGKIKLNLQYLSSE